MKHYWGFFGSLFFLFLYFAHPTGIPDESFVSTFAFAKSLLSTENYCRFWKLWPQFICLYFGIFQYNWEKEAISFQQFSFDKTFNKHIKVSWRADGVIWYIISPPPCVHYESIIPQCQYPEAIVSPVILGFTAWWGKHFIFLFRSKYKCRKGEWKPELPTCVSIRWVLLIKSFKQSAKRT